MTDIDPDTRLAAAGDAHHSAVQRLINELHIKSEEAKAAQAAAAEAEQTKALAIDDKNRISAYLESVTQNINAQVDAIVGPPVNSAEPTDQPPAA